MIILPTRNRPDNLRRFIGAYSATGATLPVTVVLDADNVAPYELVLADAPASWNFAFINKFSRCYALAVNGVFESSPNEPFYALLADDVVPLTPGWDMKLRDACQPCCVAWGDDGIYGDRNGASHPFISGDLVRAVGWLFPPYVRHASADKIWRTLSVELGIAQYRRDVLMPHLHWRQGRAEFDATYALQPSANEDAASFSRYLAGPLYKEDVRRTKERLKL